MNKTEEFLFEEYKQAYKMDRYLEASYSRIFRTYATALVWIFALLGLLYKDEIIELGIFNFLKMSHNKLFIITVLLILLIFGITSLISIVKTRKITLLYTSKINYIRRLFVCCKPQYNEYLESPILSELNKINIGARPVWSWDSEMFFFLLILSIINGFIFAMLLATIKNLPLNIISFVLLIIILSIFQILLSRRNVKKYWEKCKEKPKKYEESSQEYKEIEIKEKSIKGGFMCWKKFNNNAGAIIAVFTIILGISTLIYAICAAIMIYDQRKHAELEYRPYVGFSQILPFYKGQNKFSFFLEIANSGKTPANDISLSFNWENIYEDLYIRKITAIGDTIIFENDKKIPILYGNPTIFPGQSISLEGFNFELPPKWKDFINNGNKIEFVINVYYRGIAPKDSINFYKTYVKFTYQPINFDWIVSESNAI